MDGTKKLTRAEICAKARATRDANKATRHLSDLALTGGGKVFRDTPPGIAWVLEVKGHRRYYPTREMAVAKYEQERSENVPN